MPNVRRRPVLEPLESRELLMGASMNPPVEPVTVSLSGITTGTAFVSPAPGGETVGINASGLINMTSRSHVTGTLRVVGSRISGTLALDTPTSRLTLTASGTVFAPLHFTITGIAVKPNSSIYYTKVTGGGTFSLSFSPGPITPLVTLSFKH